MSATPTLNTEARHNLDGGPQSRRSPLFQGVVFNWASLVVVALVSILLTPIMIRDLGQYYYGMWVLVMSFLDQYGLLDMGMGSALSRYAGYFKGAEKRGALDEILSTSLAFTVAIGIVVCLVTTGLAFLLPGFFGFAGANRPTFIQIVIIMGAATGMAFPERMLAAYLRGVQRFDLVNLVGTGAVVVRGVLVFAALRAGYKVLTVAAITMAIGALSLVLHYAAARRADPDLSLRWAQVTAARFRELFSFSAYSFIASLGVRLITRVDSIVIARVLTVALVTPFSIGSRMMDYFAGLFAGIHGPLLSSMSELEGQGRQKELRHMLIASTRFSMLLSFLLGSLLVFDGRSMLRLWLGNSGTDLNISYRVMVILTGCYVAANAQMPAWTILYARARHQLLAWVVLCDGAINLGLSIYWAHRYGLVGVAMGTLVPAIFDHLLFLPWYALRVAGVSAGEYIRHGLLRPLVSSAMLGVCCWFTSRPSQSVVAFCSTVVLQLAAFAALSYGVGLPKQDRQRIAARITPLFKALSWRGASA